MLFYNRFRPKPGGLERLAEEARRLLLQLSSPRYTAHSLKGHYASSHR
jgi:hypothetical protein